MEGNGSKSMRRFNRKARLYFLAMAKVTHKLIDRLTDPLRSLGSILYEVVTPATHLLTSIRRNTAS